MKYKLLIVVLVMCVLSACQRTKEKTQDTINVVGDVVEKSEAEFVESISDGADKSLVSKVKLSDALLKKGLKPLKYTIKDSPAGGNNNLITLSINFENDFKDILYVKILDENGLESGHAKLEVKGEKGHVDYFDFMFRNDVKIESKSLILVE